MEWDTLDENTTNDAFQKHLEQWYFFLRQMREATSPNHFPFTNADVLNRIFETQGMNLAEGFQRLQNDLAANGASFLNIPLTDRSAYRIGKDLACTPGEVIFENDILQLIHYHPVTDKIWQHPVLFIPPWFNKYYILDLQPENSMVRWLTEQGFAVFMISWVNPDASYRHKTFADYMTQGPLAAMQAIHEMTGIKEFNLAGYCVGGTLLACLLATLKESRLPFNICSATFFTALLDFSQPGDLGLFIDEVPLAFIERDMQEKGYMDGRILAAIFSLLRAGDLIWPAWVKHYLKNERPSASPFLFWNSDSTNIPENVHKYYLRQFYQHNRLIKAGSLELAGQPVDLSRITQPCWFVATDRDHIAPWQSCHASSQLVSGPRQFVLAGAGHVAGIVNPPHRHRYGYRKSGRHYRSSAEFGNRASFSEGSWWPAWHTWLKKHSGKRSSVKSVLGSGFDSLEPAPGSYVKVTLADISSSDKTQ